MASFGFGICCVILVLVCLFHQNAQASGRGLRNQVSSFHSVDVSSLIPATTCNPSSSPPVGSKATSASLKVVNKHGPCHKANAETLSTKSTPSDILTADQSRATAIQSRHSNTLHLTSDVDLPANSGILFNAGDYIVQISLGTPANNFTMIFDTGSSFTWTQCEPCSGSCFPQKGPIYDPSKSSTYTNISCFTDECMKVVSATGNFPDCSDNTCTYQISYGDGSTSTGLFGQERLTLSPNDVFDSFFFGCGQDNTGIFGEVAGLIGLGQDPLSMVSQTASKFGQTFSYCLPTFSGSDGHLTLGSGTVSGNVEFTPFSSSQLDSSFYFVDIKGISVGGKTIDINPNVFQSPGTIIDSGTVITRLPAVAYSALRDAFKQQTTQLKTAPPFLFLDTCFDLTGVTTAVVPKVSFVFSGGATVDLDSKGTLISVNGTSQVCFAFAGNNDDSALGIYGNVQQQTFEVVYDISAGKLGFGAGGCS